MKFKNILLGIILTGLIPISGLSQENTTIIWVDGICGMCEDRIKKAVLELEGISTAEWNVETKMLTFTTEEEAFDVEQVHLAVTRVGHDTKKYLAPQKAYDNLHACCKYRDEEVIAAHQQPTNSNQIWVDGICGMCKDRIEAAVIELEGINTAEWDVDSRMLTYTSYDEDFDEDQIHLAVTRVGHDTKKFLAPQKVYDNLHACCKYRDAEVIASHRPQEEGIQVWVDGVCGMCEERIEKAVLEVAGVESASWDVDSRILTISTEAENFNEDQIHMAVTSVGHDTKKYKAPDDVYNNLHACCLYRDADVIADHRPAQIPGSDIEVTGLIMVEENGKVIPLPGVNIRWMNESIGTVTDVDGNFIIERPDGASQLVASYVGYYSDTLDLSNDNNIELILTAGNTLETVEVTYERKSIEVSFINPMMVQQINSKELLKAACCTLAESFETNPTVDVSFTDAVTGARQIEMLGLAGPYVQITRENLPDVRGLAAIYGLSYIPGPWVEGIQLAKGPGSVRNGYESMTGQINVELKKPEEGDQFYLNFYGNQGGRMEANVNTRFQLSDKVSTGLLLHGKNLQRKNDVNNDGFLDMPIGTEWTAVNRWKYQGDDGWAAQAGIKVTSYDKTSGQTDFDEDFQSSAWGALMNTQRLEGWAKIGRVFPDRPDASIGLQLSAISHDQDASFGNRIYNADQKSFYANLIYRQDLGSPAHQLNTGFSLQVDKYEEQLGQSSYDRNESVPGAFIEYTYQPNENFTIVGGLRGDRHNNYGTFLTPRLHVRYALNEMSVFRLSAGQGRRTSSIIAENIGMLASARDVIIENNDLETPYGLNQEVAWNFGVNWRQSLIIEDRELVLTLDGYRTSFQQQVVVDYDQNPQEVRFYNLEGNSYSNNFQAQLDYALLRNLDLRIAYRFSDVKT
ncbi:MAG: TonB-dependent receptor, partial [Saprospiraceae bacterium]|nr:TonB-dependent receptor [Saprospiraceae bacterium]